MPDRWTEAVARLSSESLITTAEAARLVRSTSGATSPGTVTRWIVHGKRGVFLDGQREAGKAWFTSREALARFWAALSRAGGSGRDVVRPVEAARLQDQRDDAELAEALRAVRRGRRATNRGR
jgi:hypothetical protein